MTVAPDLARLVRDMYAAVERSSLAVVNAATKGMGFSFSTVNAVSAGSALAIKARRFVVATNEASWEDALETFRTCFGERKKAVLTAKNAGRVPDVPACRELTTSVANAEQMLSMMGAFIPLGPRGVKAKMILKVFEDVRAITIDTVITIDLGSSVPKSLSATHVVLVTPEAVVETKHLRHPRPTKALINRMAAAVARKR